MADKIVLDVAPRTAVGKANKQLRRKGLIPANIYGHKETPQALQIDAVAFDRLKRSHSSRNIVTLHLPEGQEETALIRHVQHAPTGHILHVDFTRVALGERITANIPLNFVGTALGVKNEGGVLLPLLEALPVECTASDIVESLDVDIAVLNEIDSTLYARDIPLPANYKLVADPDEPVVKVTPPTVIPTREEEAEAAAPAETSAAPTGE
ncbi:50S ribosomal protein L25 [Tengunoibacter tsumagoiensis]|uniref:Large ribosomal subunit protein bL25 n=1 Tax=Tengunoibacter tsumagoiensis TaxID=2014871 RepID=A0A401ZU12_9CHLR|nr:50S ribosomal protein L25 [Tengunoibacter tsumagoiensis]GCE10302.1 hypothetical protein KTT_01610 [Tengunoibacter tsumagoiensis]